MSSKKMRFKHNKRRNSGLVYEFLVRKMSESLIDKDSRSYKCALAITKKYFAAGQPMAKERQLFEIIASTRGVKPNVARRVLAEVIIVAKKLDHRLIDIKKSNAIKEIHRAFGKNLFSDYKFADYKAYASIQMLINGCNPKSTINESVQRVHLEEALINYMSVDTKRHAITEKIDPLVYSITVKKFNERYNDTLCESQKRLLKKYVVALASENSSRLVTAMLVVERKRLLFEMQSAHGVKEIHEDKQMIKKLKDAENMLRELNLRESHSSHVEDMLLYCKLVEELNSNG